MSLNLKDLEMYIQVVHDGSFSLAAQHLAQPKASVSRAVQRLEADLGVRLLQRTTRSLHMTDAGQLLFEHAYPALQQIHDVVERVRDLQDQPEGMLKVTLPVDIGVAIMSHILADFMQLYPKVQMDIRLSSQVANLVADGFDLALRIKNEPPQDSALIYRKMGAVPLRFYASPTYLGKHGIPAHIADLATHQSILFQHLPMRRLEVSSPTQKTCVSLQGHLTVDHFNLVKDACLAGVGLGLMPPYLCQAELAAQQLIAVLPHAFVDVGQLYLIYGTRTHQSAALKALIGFLESRLRAHPLLCAL